jgi:hypothetical protein
MEDQKYGTELERLSGNPCISVDIFSLINAVI